MRQYGSALNNAYLDLKGIRVHGFCEMRIRLLEDLERSRKDLKRIPRDLQRSPPVYYHLDDRIVNQREIFSLAKQANRAHSK